MALAQSDSAPRPYSSRPVRPRACSAGMFIFPTTARLAILCDQWRRTSNYEGGGIGARSVGTDRNEFSVTFWQRLENHLCFFLANEEARGLRCAETADGAAEIASIGPKQRCPRRPCTAPQIGVTTTS